MGSSLAKSQVYGAAHYNMAFTTPREAEWLRSTTLSEDDSDSEMESITEERAPRHPVPVLQGAFEESMEEAINEIEVPEYHKRYSKADSVSRRKMLLEQDQYERTVAGRWKQRPGEQFHPLWKLIAQISFGMHLLHEGMAKSDEEVIKILQVHVDEIDGFLERTTEDFDLGQADITERIRYLRLPLEHGQVFDSMLGDRNFRSAIVEGNEKIEHIVDRTAAAMNDALKDVQKGFDATKELARYMKRLDKTWENRSEEHQSVYMAMTGNTEGWSRAFITLQHKGNTLGVSLVQLGGIVAEMQKRAGIASRRNLDTSSRRDQHSASPRSALRPQQPRSRPKTPASPKSPNKPLPKAPNSIEEAMQVAMPHMDPKRAARPNSGKQTFQDASRSPSDSYKTTPSSERSRNVSQTSVPSTGRRGSSQYTSLQPPASGPTIPARNPKRRQSFSEKTRSLTQKLSSFKHNHDSDRIQALQANTPPSRGSSGKENSSPNPERLTYGNGVDHSSADRSRPSTSQASSTDQRSSHYPNVPPPASPAESENSPKMSANILFLPEHIPMSPLGYPSYMDTDSESFSPLSRTPQNEQKVAAHEELAHDPARCTLECCNPLPSLDKLSSSDKFSSEPPKENPMPSSQAKISSTSESYTASLPHKSESQDKTVSTSDHDHDPSTCLLECCNPLLGDNQLAGSTVPGSSKSPVHDLPLRHFLSQESLPSSTRTAIRRGPTPQDDTSQKPLSDPDVQDTERDDVFPPTPNRNTSASNRPNKRFSPISRSSKYSSEAPSANHSRDSSAQFSNIFSSPDTIAISPPPDSSSAKPSPLVIGKQAENGPASAPIRYSLAPSPFETFETDVPGSARSSPKERLPLVLKAIDASTGAHCQHMSPVLGCCLIRIPDRTSFRKPPLAHLSVSAPPPATMHKVEPAPQITTAQKAESRSPETTIDKTESALPDATVCKVESLPPSTSKKNGAPPLAHLVTSSSSASYRTCDHDTPVSGCCLGPDLSRLSSFIQSPSSQLSSGTPKPDSSTIPNFPAPPKSPILRLPSAKSTPQLSPRPPSGSPIVSSPISPSKMTVDPPISPTKICTHSSPVLGCCLSAPISPSTGLAPRPDPASTPALISYLDGTPSSLRSPGTHSAHSAHTIATTDPAHYRAYHTEPTSSPAPQGPGGGLVMLPQNMVEKERKSGAGWKRVFGTRKEKLGKVREPKSKSGRRGGGGKDDKTKGELVAQGFMGVGKDGNWISRKNFAKT